MLNIIIASSCALNMKYLLPFYRIRRKISLSSEKFEVVLYLFISSNFFGQWDLGGSNTSFFNERAKENTRKPIGCILERSSLLEPAPKKAIVALRQRVYKYHERWATISYPFDLNEILFTIYWDLNHFNLRIIEFCNLY